MWPSVTSLLLLTNFCNTPGVFNLNLLDLTYYFADIPNGHSRTTKSIYPEQKEGKMKMEVLGNASIAQSSN